jgi:hypothetical protein
MRSIAGALESASREAAAGVEDDGFGAAVS